MINSLISWLNPFAHSTTSKPQTSDKPSLLTTIFLGVLAVGRGVEVTIRGTKFIGQYWISTYPNGDPLLSWTDSGVSKTFFSTRIPAAMPKLNTDKIHSYLNLSSSTFISIALDNGGSVQLRKNLLDSSLSSGFDFDIRLNVMDPNGKVIAPEIIYSKSQNFNSRLGEFRTISLNNGFLIGYVRTDGTQDQNHFLGISFDNQGKIIANEYEIFSGNNIDYLRFHLLTNNNVMAIWLSDDADTPLDSKDDYYRSRIFNPKTGALIGNPKRLSFLNSIRTKHSSTNGSKVCFTWYSRKDAAIFGQFVNQDNTIIGEPFVVSNSPGLAYRSLPKAAPLQNQWMFVWHEEGYYPEGGDGLLGVKIDESPKQIGSVFELSVNSGIATGISGFNLIAKNGKVTVSWLQRDTPMSDKYIQMNIVSFNNIPPTTVISSTKPVLSSTIQGATKPGVERVPTKSENSLPIKASLQDQSSILGTKVALPSIADSSIFFTKVNSLPDSSLAEKPFATAILIMESTESEDNSSLIIGGSIAGGGLLCLIVVGGVIYAISRSSDSSQQDSSNLSDDFMSDVIIPVKPSGMSKTRSQQYAPAPQVSSGKAQAVVQTPPYDIVPPEPSAPTATTNIVYSGLGPLRNSYARPNETFEV